MAIQIGQAEPGYNDPVGLMTACHRRIERFLKTLRFAAEHAGGRGLEPEEREALARALRYFREAAPHHTADEEQDLFPALVRKEPDTAVSVENLEKDHARAEELHARVDALGEKWLQAGQLSGPDLAEFRDATATLEKLYAGHIRIEETEVFPRASRALNRTDLDAIGRRMAQRRGMAYLPEIGVETSRR